MFNLLLAVTMTILPQHLKEIIYQVSPAIHTSSDDINIFHTNTNGPTFGNELLTETVITSIPNFGNIEIRTYSLDSRIDRPPKTRHDAHYIFVTSSSPSNILKYINSIPCQSYETEINLVNIFYDETEGINFPIIEANCDENTNCISDHPTVFFSVKIPDETICQTVLVTGDASVSTSTTPQKNDLPRTIWKHEEPVKNLYWAGLLNLKDNRKVIFTARPINNEVKMGSAHRITTAKKIVATLKMYERK